MAQQNRPTQAPPVDQDYLLSMVEAASFLAGAMGIAPVAPSAIRQMIEAGTLDGEQDARGRFMIRLSALKAYVAAQKAAKPDAAQVAPQSPTQPAPTVANPGGYKLVALDDSDADDDLDYCDCPNCGEGIPVTPSSLVVGCPSCGATFEVQQEDDDDTPPAPAKAPVAKAPAPAPAAPTQQVKTNPGFLAARFGRNSRRG